MHCIDGGHPRQMPYHSTRAFRIGHCASGALGNGLMASAPHASSSSSACVGGRRSLPSRRRGGDAIFAVGERKTLYLDARMAHAFDATGTAMRST